MMGFPAGESINRQLVFSHPYSIGTREGGLSIMGGENCRFFCEGDLRERLGWETQASYLPFVYPPWSYHDDGIESMAGAGRRRRL